MGKRALIVDDSKSARAFLSRILVKYEIEVDCAESAEQALEYLRDERPDVIFMDHLMPGMDGFQAVQLIKNNPRTATIPIMMYTSQEGELYVGQARALGAIGVLPKQIQPADVSKVLYQLRLIVDRRHEEPHGFTSAPGEAEPGVSGTSTTVISPAPSHATAPHSAAPATTPVHTLEELRGLVESVGHEQGAELRRFVASQVEEQVGRLQFEVRALADVVRAPAPKPWGWIAALVATALAGTAIGFAGWREMQHRVRVDAALVVARDRALALEEQVKKLEASESARVEEIGSTILLPQRSASGLLARAPVPYGGVPLSEDRIGMLREVFARLSSDQFHGIVDVAIVPGRFCLVGNATDGYSVAPDDVPVSRCDLIGNPAHDGANPAQRESIAWANLLADLRRTNEGAFEVRVVPGDASQTVIDYPQPGGRLTAAEWNRIALANNRIELRARPAP